MSNIKEVPDVICFVKLTPRKIIKIGKDGREGQGRRKGGSGREGIGREEVHEDGENVHKVHANLSAKRYMRYGWGQQIYNGSRDVTTPLSGTVCSPYAGTSYDRPAYQSNQTHDDGIYRASIASRSKNWPVAYSNKMINDKKY